MMSIDREQVAIEFSRHALERCEEREVSHHEAYLLLTQAGEELLELKNGQKTAVVDYKSNIGLLCSITAVGGIITIDVISALSEEATIWISRGTKIITVANPG